MSHLIVHKNERPLYTSYCNTSQRFTIL
jgi:hypothetical protein